MRTFPWRGSGSVATSRRGFLLRTLAVSGAAVGGGAFVPGCLRWVDPARVVDLPAPVNGKLSIDPSRYPDLAPLGSAIALHSPGVELILLVHWNDGSYAALAGICTHQGCPLGFNDHAVECPCHGARYDASGTVLNPPAPQALRTYQVTLDTTSGDLIIDLLAGTAGFPSVVNGKIFFPFADYPQLKTAGGAVAGIPTGLGKPLVVIALQGGGYSALDATCTHQGCTVAYSQPNADLVCPCHGSTFSLTGVVTSPPANKPLQSFAATSDATGVTVTVA